MGDWKRKIEKYRRKRTLDQNAYLRSWVYWTIAKETWEEAEYIHWSLSYKFLLDRARKTPYVRSTASLSTIEFNEYIERISAFIADFWITIPTPDQYKENIEHI